MENFRLAIPLDDNDTEAFPVGAAINYNAQIPFEFDTFGEQCPCPLVFLLSNLGQLFVFNAINLDKQMNRSICYKSKPMPFLKEKLNQNNKLPSKQSDNVKTPLPVSSPNVTFTPTVVSNLPIPSFNQFQNPNQQKVVNFSPQLPVIQKNQIQQQQPSLFQQQPLKQVSQPLLETKQQQISNIQSNQQQQLEHRTQTPADISTQIKVFDAEITDFKNKVSKLFGDKDLSKDLVKLSIIKDTKAAEVDYQKINTQIQVKKHFIFLFFFI
jgi:hypothetical protein